MPPIEVDPALHRRFAADLAGAVGRPVVGKELLALAVSGGPDSMAMLALASSSFPGRVIAATVDHGLRVESADEAAMVARCCQQLGVPHATLRPAADRDPRENLHVWARRERYAALADWARNSGAPLLLTAHHADDQAETFLMRAARGAGLSGLAGIRPRQAMPGDVPLLVVRPLLGWRRDALRALVADLKMPFVDDPSNADTRFDRARFRAWLATADSWLDVSAIARAAAHLADVDADLADAADRLWHERRRAAPAGTIVLDTAQVPRELRRRLARRAIAALLAERDSVAPREAAADVEPLLDALEAGQAATHADILVRPAGNLWRFSPAPPRRSH
jgi:tRNA(Ile)-lysidine synthase